MDAEIGRNPENQIFHLRSNFSPLLISQQTSSFDIQPSARYRRTRANTGTISSSPSTNSERKLRRAEHDTAARARHDVARLVPVRHVHAVTANHFKSDTALAHVRSRFKRVCLLYQCSANEPIQAPSPVSQTLREPADSSLSPYPAARCFSSARVSSPRVCELAVLMTAKRNFQRRRE